jgi:hypothetical protein
MLQRDPPTRELTERVPMNPIRKLFFEHRMLYPWRDGEACTETAGEKALSSRDVLLGVLSNVQDA